MPSTLSHPFVHSLQSRNQPAESFVTTSGLATSENMDAYYKSRGDWADPMKNHKEEDE